MIIRECFSQTLMLLLLLKLKVNFSQALNICRSRLTLNKRNDRQYI